MRDSYFTDLYKYHLKNIDFKIYYPCEIFPNLKHDISLIYNKLESGGGFNCNGYYFYHDKESAQWFLDHKDNICYFVYDVSILYTIEATAVHTFEATSRS